MNNLQMAFNDKVDLAVRCHLKIIFNVFEDNGFDLWVVGGACRDLVMGKQPKDFDLASNAPLDEVKRMFQNDRVIATGEDHGTLTIHMGAGQDFEVTRFRRDVATDGRRATVEFAESLGEDLCRRDFTINAIAFNPFSGEIFDPFFGIEHIKNRLLRFIGSPSERIQEDHLRALRFVRFVARGFGFQQEDFAEVQKFFDEYILSQERINEELEKILESLVNNDFPPDEIVKQMLIRLNLLGRLFSNFDQRIKTIGAMIEFSHGRSQGSLFPLAIQMGKNHGLEHVTESMKMPADVRKLVGLFCNLEILFKCEIINRPFIKKCVNIIGKNFGNNKLDAWIHFSEFMLLFNIQGVISDSVFNNVMEYSLDIQHNKHPILMNELAINGKDVQELGFKGPDIGLMLNKALEFVWRSPKCNSKEFLVEFLAQVKAGKEN